MRIFGPFVFRSVALISLALAVPVVALAGGGTGAPASPQPQPVRQIKVWTNDDLAALVPRFESTTESTQIQAARPADAAVVSPNASDPPLEPEQDPYWYAEQLTGLESELASVASQEQQLRHFRATSKGLPTGLNVVAPCVGVGTDNLIAMLAARRQEITQELDTLADTARTHGMTPGILVEGRGRVSLVPSLTPEQQQAALLDQYTSLSDELAQTQATIAAMHAEAASRRETLLQPDARWGGNMTTNLLQTLYNRESELQSELSSIEDELRSTGLEPEALR